MPTRSPDSLKFSKRTKEELRREANYRCETCGKPAQKLEIHHRLPQGIAKRKHPDITPDLIRSRDNGKVLCPECHQIEDKLSRTYHEEFAEELRKKRRTDLR